MSETFTPEENARWNNHVRVLFKKDDPSLMRRHAGIGINSEYGEIMTLLKRHIAYGKPMADMRHEFVEELGDYLFFVTALWHCEEAHDFEIHEIRRDLKTSVAMIDGETEMGLACGWIMNELGITMREVIEHNIAKLSKRYPEGYSDQAALARADKETANV